MPPAQCRRHLASEFKSVYRCVGPKGGSLTPSGEEEFQRFMGFRASLVPWKANQPGGSETPRRRHGGPFRHPIAWVRWRIAIRRSGPYAPDFAEFRLHPMTKKK